MAVSNPTIPNTLSGAAAGTTINDLMQRLYDFFSTQVGGFTLSNVVGGPSAVTSFTATHSSGRQVNFRISGGAILVMIDPDGTIADSSAPGSPTNASPELVFVPASPTGISTACGFAQYGDAILFYVKDTSAAFQQYCSHVGRIAVMDLASDEEVFIDGWGILGYIPNESPGSGLGDWGCVNAANSHCVIRMGESTWLPFTFVSTANVSDTSGNRRFGAIDIHAGDSGSPTSTSDPSVGELNYIKIDGQTDAAPLGVPPSTASNQAWLRLNDANSNTRMVALWNKGTTP
tara:strand:- start:286 stop:1152 length:867 start_codon:yes stop_codon:yes gene_type:complete